MQGRKLFYKIGEVSRLAGLEPYVLRYWESVFPVLTPRKNRGGQRVYLQKDVDLIFQIKRMLHLEGYTIAGALKKLESGTDSPFRPGGQPRLTEAEPPTAVPDPEDLFGGVQGELELGEVCQADDRIALNASGADMDPALLEAVLKLKAGIKEVLELIKD